MAMLRSLQRLVTAVVLCVPGLVFAQSAAPSARTNAATPPKTGTATVKLEMVPSLFVMNSRGATLSGQTLTLTGVMPNAIVFADRPVRAAGHVLTTDVLQEWTAADGSFAKDPPNATVSAAAKDGSSLRDAVVELRSPRLEGDRLTFDVRVLEGDLTGADGPAALFIDIIGLPFTPMSYAGMARRSARRAAWYGAAAAAYPPPYPSAYPYPRPYYPPY